MKTKRYQDLEVGDIVRIAHSSPYLDSTVVKKEMGFRKDVNEGTVFFERPYIHIDKDTGISYIGMEHWSHPFFVDSTDEVEVW